ncbi:MAG: short-chain dehydrogenase [Labilithrix sp.]|nr:short-chain dehydrogenase [Labilithrix sp.]
MATTAPRVVVVTGASAGVGRAIARAFAQRGSSVALLARGIDGLEGARRDVESLGARAVVIPCDVADEEQVEDAADRAELELGPIDVWVNNAMVSVFSPADRITPDEYRRVTDVTYLGFVWGTLAALRRMKPRDRGVVVQVGSALAHRSIPLQSAYCAAKHAVKGFTESVRTELIHDRSSVKISIVELPAVNTPQFDWTRSRMPRRAQPVPPIFQPEVPAEAVVNAAMHPRREMLVGWPTVKAILAEKLAPGIADWYLGRTGYDAQQTHEAERLGRRDNLFAPVPGDHGAHGRFDDRARPRSMQLWMSLHRGLVALGLLALGTAAAFGALGVRRRALRW